MKALILKEKGKLPVYTDTKAPQSDDKRTIVDLSFSALNHRDVWITKGKYPRIREGSILGSDGMGFVNGERVLINPGMNWGKDQSYQSKEFEVLGMPTDGTFAQQVAIDPKLIYKVPQHLNDEEAAAIPLGGVTAFRALITRCQLKKGENVLINGVGGGVAHFAMLFALAANANVYVTSASTSKIEKAKSLGAIDGTSYKDDDYPNNVKEMCSEGYDVIIDSAAGKPFKYLIELCAPGGRIGIYGGTLGKINEVNPQILFWRQISILGSTMGSQKDFQDMLDYVAQHKIHPIIDDVIPMSEFHKGFERLEDFEQFGKVVFDNHA